MKKLFFTLFLVAVLSLQNLYAVVAYPYPVDTRQSDGKTLTVVLRGDEKVSWARTLDNFTLMRDKNDDYVYAVPDGNGGIKPSTIIAHNQGERTAVEIEFLSRLQTNLFYSSEQVSIMKQYWDVVADAENKSMLYQEMGDSVNTYKILVVLMSFNDYAFTTSQEDVENLFNQVGYSKNGHQGSVHDYFLAATYGKLNVEATVVGPYVASHDLEYYGENWEGTHSDMHARDLIREAAEFADIDVNFAEFANGGTNVPCMYVIYAGYAESSGNSSYTIWPHQGMLGNPYYGDGVEVNKYSCSSEFNGTPYSRQPLTIGTICHEFSHALGQADYYDTDYEENGNAFVPDEWDIMSSGNYNNGGKCPPLWSARERYAVSYLTLEELTQAGTYTLPSLQNSNKAYKISVPNSNEYFILENRQQVGWDKYLPGHGLLVFRYNPNVDGWNYNCANCVANAEGYLLISANNTRYVGSGNTFPGTSNKTSFTDNTSPAMLSSSGVAVGKPLYYISENTTTGNITFAFMDTTGYARIINSQVNFASDTMTMQASIASNISISSKGFCYSTTNTLPTTNDNTIISNASGSDINAILTNYDNNTTYYVRAFASSGNHTNYGECFTIKTPCVSSSLFPNLVGFEDDEPGLECWTQESNDFVANKWQSVSASVDGGVESAANGERFAYIHNDYNSANQETMLVTPPSDITVLDSPKLVFSHHQKYNGNQRDYLRVYYKTSLNGNWVLLQNYNNTNITSWQRDTINLPVKSKTLFIGFMSYLKGAYGIGIDDVEIIETNASAFPAVAINNVQDVSDNSSVANINVSSAGYTSLSRVGVVVSENPNPTINDIVYVANENSLGVQSIYMADLESSTTYYVRAFAQNHGLVSYSEQRSFTTLCTRVAQFPYSPVINSADTTCFSNEGGWFAEDDSYAFSTNTASYTSKLILPIMNLANRDNMTLQFDYKQAASVTPLRVLFRNGTDGTWEEIGYYSNASSDYTPITTTITTNTEHQTEEAYIAFEAIGVVGGKVNIKNIIVNATLQIPIVSTDAIDLASYNSIDAEGNVMYGGLSNVTSRGFCYSSTNNQPTLNDNTITAGNGTGSFSAIISNLELLTTYYVRAYATNSYGTSYGETKSITTLFIPVENNVISADQTLCEGTVPERLQGAEPTGGNGEFAYLWISSTDSIAWEPCHEGNLNNLQYYNPRQLSTTTYYARIVTSGATIDTSNVVTINVSSYSRGGNVFAAVDEAFMYDTISLQVRAHNGEVQYWEYKRPYYDWQIEENSEGLTTLFTTPVSEGYWSYRAVVKSGACSSATSGADSVYIKYAVGLNDAEANNYNFVLTPNPSDGNVVLICNGINEEKAFITISSISGQTMMRKEMLLHQQENPLNLNSLPTGNYIIRVEGENINWKGKLIITKR